MFALFLGWADRSYAEIDVHPLLAKANEERITKAFQPEHIQLHWGQLWWTFDSGTAIAGWESSPGCGCREKVAYNVTSTGIQFTCPGRCWNGDGSEAPSGQQSYELGVQLLSTDLELAVLDVDGNRLLLDFDQCEQDPAGSPGLRYCPDFAEAVLVEVIPAAKDRKLFDAVLARLKSSEDLAKARPQITLFEGPAARNPRVVTEVFFANRGEAAARKLAVMLEPLVGGCPVNPWPGAWDYDVIVVVGQRAHGAPILGSRLAPIRITQFADFECPESAKLAANLLRMAEKHGDKAAIEFKQRPGASHPGAALAAEAALAAHAQGRFWEMQARLFAHQTALDRASLEKHAKELGLDMKRFKASLDSGEFKAQVEKDLAEAQAAGLEQATGFLLNDRPISGAKTADELDALISQIASETPKK